MLENNDITVTGMEFNHENSTSDHKPSSIDNNPADMATKKLYAHAINVLSWISTAILYSAFPPAREVPIKFALSVRLPVRKKQVENRWTDFHKKNVYWRVFITSVNTFQLSSPHMKTKLRFREPKWQGRPHPGHPG
jgi:hypothetical protein